MEQLEHLLPVQNNCGETPIWVPEEMALYWVDTGGRSVYRYTPADGCCTRFPTRWTPRRWPGTRRGSGCCCPPTGYRSGSRAATAAISWATRSRTSLTSSSATAPLTPAGAS
jgi:sugar lactone lactonase YvrE